MSIRDYLRERAAESRHNELSAYLMFLAGSILFVGGILETSLVASEVEWLLFIPVGISATPGSTLGLVLTLSGLALAVFGLVAGARFARGRAWYMNELSNANVAEGRTLAGQRAREEGGTSASTHSPPKAS